MKITGVRIDSAERLNNSTSGNPRWRVRLDNGQVFTTQSDAACSYDVANLANGRHGRPPLVVVVLTRSGRIADLYAEGSRS